MLIGIGIGVAFAILMILSFMAGYGMADQKNNPSDE